VSSAGGRGPALAALFAAALLMLLAGTLVYVFDRPAGSAWLLPAGWELAAASPRLGAAGQWLPSLAHGFAFSLLTALGLPLRRACAAAACAGWALVDTLAEVAQHALLSHRVAAAIDAVFGDALWALQVGRYFTQGSFDPADVMAGLAGCGLAYLALHRVLARRRPPRDEPVGRAGG
jgi:hypothetical protein